MYTVQYIILDVYSDFMRLSCFVFVIVVARFGVKEEYMLFMNEFVEGEIKNMKEFINRISVSL